MLLLPTGVEWVAWFFLLMNPWSDAESEVLAAEARQLQVEAAGDLLAYLEGRDDRGLQKAAASLAKTPPDAADDLAPDRLVYYPVSMETPFLLRVAAHLSSGGSAQWADMPQFEALLRHLCRQDYRLLRIHLADVAATPSPDKEETLEIDSDTSTIMLMIRTLRPERWDFEHKLATAFLGLRAGDRIADIGSGSGFFTFRFSRAVGPGGRVYAVDVNPKHLAFIDENQDLMPFDNVETSRSTLTQNDLESDSVDFVFISNIFFDVESYAAQDKATFYASVKRILKPTGHFVLCDHADTYRGKSYEEVLRRVRAAGFGVVDSYAWPAVCVKATK